MAMATGDTKPPSARGGYPLNILPPNMDAKYLCSHCRLVLRDPVQCFCGHRFCSQCLSDITRQSAESLTCSSCLAENSVNEYSTLSKDQSFPDNALKREMFGMTVTCPQDGCDWIGTLKLYAMDHEANCGYRMFACECGMMVPVSQIETHKESACSARGLACNYCGDTISPSTVQMHQLSCPKFPVSCSSCYQSNILREALGTHIRADCPIATGRCPFGCPDEIDPAETDAHMAANVNKHMMMMVARIGAIDGAARSQDSTTTAQPGGSLSDLEKRVRDVELRRSPLARGDSAAGETSLNADGKIREILLKVSTFEGIVSVLRDEQERCINLIEQAQMQNSANSRHLEPLEAKVAAAARELEIRDARITELESRLAAQESVSYDGYLVWKITDFSKRRREAISMTCTSIYSPAFYTHHTGYKMCTRLYPNGDGMGKDKYVSLFFVVMRGQYDALLPWPFRQKVTFMLLDQIGREHISDAFRPDPGSSSFRRPTSEMNIASGCPMFVKLDDLDKMAVNYVKDDVMFIKIIVAPLDKDDTSHISMRF